MGVITAAYRLFVARIAGDGELLGTTFAGGASEELLSDVTGVPGEAIRSPMRQLPNAASRRSARCTDQPYFMSHE